MQRFLLVIQALIALAAFSSPAGAEEAKALKGLLVCGGCCHDFTAQKKILSEGLSARANVSWTIVHEDAPNKEGERKHKVSIYLKPEWWKGYDVVLHSDCFGAVDDNAFIDGIATAHKEGVPAVILHCASHSYRAGTTDEWRKCVGITSRSHEKRRDLTVRVMKADHPVMKGFPTEWLNKNDELYKNEHIWPNCVPLAQAYGQDTKKDHVVIWVNTYGKGRVFSTTLGHTNETMSDPVYLDLVARGMLWACEKLTEEGTPARGFGPGGK